MPSPAIIGVGLNIISAIFILAFVSLGLAIVFGFLGVINLSHGAFMTIGAYTVWLLVTENGLSFWLALLVAPLVAAVLGLVLEELMIKHLYHRLIDTLLATWGVAILIRESIKLQFGPTPQSVNNPLPGSVDLLVATHPTYRVFLLVLSGAVFLGVTALFYWTNFGVRLRAVIQDSEMASLLGLNQRRMYQFSFAFGSGLAGLAGAAIVPISTLEPDMGLNYLIDAFFAIIVGGAGTILGPVYGSTVIAGINNALTYVASPVLSRVAVFSLVVVILAVRAYRETL